MSNYVERLAEQTLKDWQEKLKDSAWLRTGKDDKEFYKSFFTDLIRRVIRDQVQKSLNAVTGDPDLPLSSDWVRKAILESSLENCQDDNEELELRNLASQVKALKQAINTGLQEFDQEFDKGKSLGEAIESLKTNASAKKGHQSTIPKLAELHPKPRLVIADSMSNLVVPFTLSKLLRALDWHADAEQAERHCWDLLGAKPQELSQEAALWLLAYLEGCADKNLVAGDSAASEGN